MAGARRACIGRGRLRGLAALCPGRGGEAGGAVGGPRRLHQLRRRSVVQAAVGPPQRRLRPPALLHEALNPKPYALLHEAPRGRLSLNGHRRTWEAFSPHDLPLAEANSHARWKVDVDADPRFRQHGRWSVRGGWTCARAGRLAVEAEQHLRGGAPLDAVLGSAGVGTVVRLGALRRRDKHAPQQRRPPRRPAVRGAGHQRQPRLHRKTRRLLDLSSMCR